LAFRHHANVLALHLAGEGWASAGSSVTRAPFIDTTMLRIDIGTDVVGNANEQDRARARRVVGYVCQRVPAARNDDSPTSRVGRGAEAGGDRR
jgi:hypothetical protein